MTRNTGSTNSETHGLQSTPHDGGCPHCGRSTTPVALTDFGLETGQLCPHCGIVDAAHPIATDGGADVDECDECEQLDDDLECWACYRRSNR